MTDQQRCDRHGGKTPNGLAAAARRRTERQARAALASLGEAEPVTDPIGELERLAGEVLRLVAVLRDMVGQLDEIRYRGGLGAEQVRGEVQVYLQTIARAESILGRIVALDLDARRVRLQEAQAALVVTAFAKVLRHRELALAPELQRRARSLLAAELGQPTGAVEQDPAQTVAVTP